MFEPTENAEKLILQHCLSCEETSEETIQFDVGKAEIIMCDQR
jgi:hypothetical protein